MLLDAGCPPRLKFGAQCKPQRMLVEGVETVQPVDQRQRNSATSAVEQPFDFVAQRIGEAPAAVGARNREPFVEIGGNIAEIVEQQLVAARPAGLVEGFGLDARRLGPDVGAVGFQDRRAGRRCVANLEQGLSKAGTRLGFTAVAPQQCRYSFASEALVGVRTKKGDDRARLARREHGDLVTGCINERETADGGKPPWAAPICAP